MGFSVVLRRKFCSSMLQALLRIGTTVGSAAGNPSVADSTPGEPAANKVKVRSGWLAAAVAGDESAASIGAALGGVVGA